MGLKFAIKEKLREMSFEKDYARKRYERLSLVELNAYDGIVKRRRPEPLFLTMPIAVIRAIFFIGLFTAYLCWIYGIDFDVIRASVVTIIHSLFNLFIPIFLISYVGWVICLLLHNRMKIKLLNRI